MLQFKPLPEDPDVDPNVWIFGTIFLQKYDSVYDMKGRIGLIGPTYDHSEYEGCINLECILFDEAIKEGKGDLIVYTISVMATTIAIVLTIAFIIKYFTSSHFRKLKYKEEGIVELEENIPKEEEKQPEDGSFKLIR